MIIAISIGLQPKDASMSEFEVCHRGILLLKPESRKLSKTVSLSEEAAFRGFVRYRPDKRVAVTFDFVC